MNPLGKSHIKQVARSGAEYVDCIDCLLSQGRKLLIEATRDQDNKARRDAYWQLVCINIALGIPTEPMERFGIEPVPVESDDEDEGGAA